MTYEKTLMEKDCVPLLLVKKCEPPPAFLDGGFFKKINLRTYSLLLLRDIMIHFAQPQIIADNIIVLNIISIKSSSIKPDIIKSDTKAIIPPSSPLKIIFKKSPP